MATSLATPGESGRDGSGVYVALLRGPLLPAVQPPAEADGWLLIPGVLCQQGTCGLKQGCSVTVPELPAGGDVGVESWTAR